MKTGVLKTMLVVLALAFSAITAQAAPNIEAPSCAKGTPPSEWIHGQAATNIPALAGGNTGACKRSCDNALERCMQSGKARPHCQDDWRWCSRGCERS